MYHFIRSSQDSSCGDLFGETFHCLGAVAVLQVGRSSPQTRPLRVSASGVIALSAFREQSAKSKGLGDQVGG